MSTCSSCKRPESADRPHSAVRRVAFGAVVVAVLAVVLILGRQPSAQPNVARAVARFNAPEAVVAALVAAEQAADVEGYANCFAGSLREKFDVQRGEAQGEQLLAELKSRAINLTGHVTTDLQQPDADSATLVLERVFRNHNSRSRVRLNRYGGAWKIVEQTPLDNFAPEIPYGTPVFMPPAGEKSQISNSKSQTNSRSEREK